ncbi:MAG TPA: WYL domain-containing protein, partial [Kouleothrix sp.]|nr:WYL domain-containing protein [Kouleothrix sp.]
TALGEGRMLRVRYSSRAQPEPTERIIRPIEIVRQRETLFLRAYCYFRQDLRAFVIDKLHDVELIEDSPA